MDKIYILQTKISKKKKIERKNILAIASLVEPIWDGPCKHVPCKIPMQKVRIVIWLNICPRLSLQKTLEDKFNIIIAVLNIFIRTN